MPLDFRITPGENFFATQVQGRAEEEHATDLQNVSVVNYYSK